MARLPIPAAALLLLFIVFELVVAFQLQVEAGLPEMNSGHQAAAEGFATGQMMSPSSCPDACDVRCSQTSKRKPCMKYCQLCCQKCLCVPPGFYGNKQSCPCYDDMKNARGGPKCP